VNDAGDEQLANVPSEPPGPSSRHSIVTPLSFDEKVKLEEAVVTAPDGPVRTVMTGARVSIVTIRDADVADVFPAASVLLTV
jgi:hypothetical protein